MKQIPSLFFLFCICILSFLTWNQEQAESVFQDTSTIPYERTYQVDLSRGNWKLEQLDTYFPEIYFQVLEVTVEDVAFTVKDRSSLKQDVIDYFSDQQEMKTALNLRLHHVPLEKVTVVTDEKNIERLARQYSWIEYA